MLDSTDNRRKHTDRTAVPVPSVICFNNIITDELGRLNRRAPRSERGLIALLDACVRVGRDRSPVLSAWYGRSLAKYCGGGKSFSLPRNILVRS